MVQQPPALVSPATAPALAADSMHARMLTTGGDETAGCDQKIQPSTARIQALQQGQPVRHSHPWGLSARLLIQSPCLLPLAIPEVLRLIWSRSSDFLLATGDLGQGWLQSESAHQVPAGSLDEWIQWKTWPALTKPAHGVIVTTDPVRH